jgi:ATP-dependent exoDNAse (exonuclease V) beta subunit
MQKENFDDLSQRVGVALSVTKAFEDDMEQVVTSDHPILSLINLARLRKVPLRKQYDLSNILYTWEEVSYIQRAYDAYKLSNMVYDYTDILENFATKGIHNCPAFTLCFMDEAQDLSPLQWDIAHGLDELSTRMYAAGDDDQAIYRWAGADVDHFINHNGASQVLEQGI